MFYEQVIKMLLAIVLLFAVCWSPTLIDNVLVEFGLVNRYHHGYLRYARQAFALMSYYYHCYYHCNYNYYNKYYNNYYNNYYYSPSPSCHTTAATTTNVTVLLLCLLYTSPSPRDS